MRRTLTILTAAFFAAGIAFAQEPPTIGQAAQQAQKDKEKKDEDRAKKEQKKAEQQQQDQQPQPQVKKPEIRQPQQPQQPPQQRDRDREKQPPSVRPWRSTLPDVQKVPEQRLSRERQKDLIEQQKKRSLEFDQRLEKQRADNERRSSDLRRQKRNEQYRFHEQYLERLREQQQRAHRSHDWRWDIDPFFVSPPVYRYWRGGRWFQVNEYAAHVLQDAVNYGYEEGYRAGAADREDHWRYDCEGSFAWQDATYGYDGFYVTESDYAYYFRAGFRRGYEDGYYRRHRYGEEVDGGFRIFVDTMRLILDLRALD